ncbi:alkaline phosphatase D family protein [Actinoplanes sp. NPDC049599]|uniref:alkaline phosphatase D family protein n=1 Tax=Actinoplanes sp. NPDC049599 TaxID=3363903 RepID=UPI0037A4269A
MTTLRRASRIWLLLAVGGFAVLAVTIGVPRNPEGEGLAARTELPAQLALLALALVGGLLPRRGQGVAAVLVAVAGNGLGVLAALAYHPAVSVLVLAVFLPPAVGLWLGWRHGRSGRRVLALAATTAVLLTGTWAGASRVHTRWFGPAHPVSTQAAPAVDRVVWTWAGAVTTTSATVVAEVVRPARRARLLITPDRPGAVPPATAVPVGDDGVVRLPATGLRPATAYRYVIEVDAVADRARGAGRFRTMPDGPASFTVAVGSCARTGSSGAVFDAIRAVAPLLYINAGDLHYGNPSRNDVATFGELYRRTLTSPAQAALYRSVPVAYVWDDHDYGPNDADAAAATRPAARRAYGTYVPHYPQPEPGQAVYQAFTIGRVRFVLTDNRSERTGTSLLGARQLAWLERELVTAARTHAVVVWVNPDPWIAAPARGADDWGGYPRERRALADVVAAARIDNLIMIAGDAHMIALDDGSHSGYSGSGYPGFPVLQAGALDRPGSVKGGPYSHGTFPGGGQFGTITITDDATSRVGVELAGRTWRNDVLVSYRTTFPAPPPG